MRRFDVTDIWVGDYDLPDGHVCGGIPSLRMTRDCGVHRASNIRDWSSGCDRRMMPACGSIGGMVECWASILMPPGREGGRVKQGAAGS